MTKKINKKNKQFVKLARLQYHFQGRSSNFWAFVGWFLQKPTLGLRSTRPPGRAASPFPAEPTGLGDGLLRLSHLLEDQHDQTIHQIPWIIRWLYTKSITVTVTAHYLQQDQENGIPQLTLPFFDPPDNRLPILKDNFSLLLSLPTKRGQKNLLPGPAPSSWLTLMTKAPMAVTLLQPKDESAPSIIIYR